MIAKRTIAASLPPLSFDSVVGRANNFTNRDRTETFGRLIMGEVGRLHGTARVLDVGCGQGLSVNDGHGSSALAAIRMGVGELWGCEPDPDVVPNPLLHQFVRGTLEDAELPEGYFDLVYAHLVVEHVTDPLAFLAKAFRVLKPSGRLLFITPNERHYFVKVARVVAALQLEEAILNIIHKGAAEAHYPTKYLLNGEKAIMRASRDVGFRTAVFAYFEHGDVRSYFHPLVRWIPTALERVMRFAGYNRLPGLVARLER